MAVQFLGVDAYTWLALVGAIIGTILAAYGFSWLLSRILKYEGYPKEVTRRFGRLVRYVVYTMGAALTISYFAFSIAGALGSLVGLGVFGIAVGIALGSVLTVFVTGAFVILDRSFAVGDEIRIASYEGKIVRIGIRRVVLVTKDDQTVFIPTAYFLSFPFSCKTCKGKLKVEEEIGEEW